MEIFSKNLRGCKGVHISTNVGMEITNKMKGIMDEE